MCARMRALAALVTVGATLGGCARPASRPGLPAVASSAHWVATWTAPQQITEPRNLPPSPGLAGNTIRQVVHTSLGGSTVRVRFSNVFGDGELSIARARIALSAGGGAVVPASDRALTFDGGMSVRLAAGTSRLSDPLEFDAPALTDLAITTRIEAMPEQVTGHPGSRTTSYLMTGDHVSDVTLTGAVTTEHWYVVAAVDVVADDAAAGVVALGNSITDGRGSGTDRQNRWPDNLARRLQGDPRTRQIAVVNAGIGGNKVVEGGLGPTALARLERDVIEQPGARWLIVLEGVNDLGGATPAQAAGVAQALIAAYRRIIARAHAAGLRACGATILPFGESFYDEPAREAARQTVNDWIRTSGEFDAVIDFDAGLRDPAKPTRLLPAADTGDHLHPNEMGYRMMAEMIDLSLFIR